MTFDFDAIIIGGGFAGLSAASALARQIHTVGVFDSGAYHNDGSQHIHALPTWDHAHPASFRDEAKKQILANYHTVQFLQLGIQSLKAMENKAEPASGNAGTAFEAIDNNGKSWTCRKVILASGVEDVYPEIPGYAECWVKGIFHCLICHGYEERASGRSGVLAVGEVGAVPAAMHMACMALQITPKVTIYTNGSSSLASSLEASFGLVNHASSSSPPGSPKSLVADARKIARFEKGPKGAEVVIHFEDGTSITEGYIAHKPSVRLRGDLWKQLGVETTPQGHMQVSPPFNQTNVRGVFAAGDASTPMMTATQALFGGSMTAAGLLTQLQAEMYGMKGII